MSQIKRDELKRKLNGDSNAVIIDVLSVDEFEDFHLPKAVNVPFGQDFAQRVQYAFPDRELDVVVYGQNQSTEASDAAAEMLRKAGYTRVSNYAAGKEDWYAAGLPVRH